MPVRLSDAEADALITAILVGLAPLLIGVLLVAVLHRLDLAVGSTARSDARTAEKGADLGPASAGQLAAPSLPDAGHLPPPPASRLATRTGPHRITPVGLVSQLTNRLVPKKFRSTPTRPR